MHVNASGTIKLPLHLIGKAKRPRWIKNGFKNAWMDTSIFYDWFHQNFVPHVRDKLSSLGLESKAVLVLDN